MKKSKNSSSSTGFITQYTEIEFLLLFFNETIIISYSNHGDERSLKLWIYFQNHELEANIIYLSITYL